MEGLDTDSIIARQRESASNYREDLANDQRMFELEQSIVKQTQSTCPITSIQQKQHGVFSVQLRQAFEQAAKQYYNIDSVAALQCVIDGIVSRPRNDGISYQEMVNEYFTGAKRIGADSAEGLALLSNVGNASNAIIMKVPKDPSNKGLVHELFVGTRSLNQLRQYIPNFAYVFGGFTCHRPWLDINNKVNSLCTGDGADMAQYVLYENIQPSISLRDYIAKCRLPEFLNVYLQVIMALDLAYRQYGFTHYDLHYENVLIRNDGTGGVIEHRTEDGKRHFINTAGVGVATLIDYGMARVYDRGCKASIYAACNINDKRSYGLSDRRAWGIQPDKGYPMHDAYKLLGFCMHEASRVNPELFRGLIPLYQQFNGKEDPYRAIARQRELLYFLPYVEAWAQVSHYSIAKAIMALYPGQLPFYTATRPGGAKMLGCWNCPVTTEGSQAVLDLGMVTTAPKTPVEFYDLYLRIKNDPQRLQQAIAQFSQRHLAEINQYTLEFTKVMQAIAQSMAIMVLRQSSVTTIVDPGFVSRYRAFVDQYAARHSLIFRARTMVNVLESIYLSMNRIDLYNDLMQEKIILDDRQKDWEAAKRSIVADANHITALLKTPQRDVVMRESWYINNLTTYRYL